MTSPDRAREQGQSGIGPPGAQPARRPVPPPAGLSERRRRLLAGRVAVGLRPAELLGHDLQVAAGEEGPPAAVERVDRSLGQALELGGDIGRLGAPEGVDEVLQLGPPRRRGRRVECVNGAVTIASTWAAVSSADAVASSLATRLGSNMMSTSVAAASA